MSKIIWKKLGSRELKPSNITLRAYDRCHFFHVDLFHDVLVQLSSKIVLMDLKLDYIIFLGYNYILEELKLIFHSPKMSVASPPPTGEKSTLAHNKELHTKRACVICEEYGHYTHHFPKIAWYWDALGALSRATTKTPLLYVALVKDDGLKTMFYAFKEKTSRTIHPFSHPLSIL